jgi:hypothetical protein
MSSSFVSPATQRERQTVFNPKTGRSIPYDPFPNKRKSKSMSVSKVKKVNPFSLNVPHHSHY